ncbi:MAG: sialidase family protein [Planctomycetota bacterium]
MRPKLIQWGWGTPSTAELGANPEVLEQVPLDGLILSANATESKVGSKRDWSQNLTWRGFGTEVFERDQFLKILDNLKSIRRETISNSFLQFNITPGTVDWFDDGGFENILNNVKIAAWIAKQAGMKGWMFDLEQYGDTLIFQYPKLKHAKTKSHQEYADIVRKRGRQIMRTINSEFPEVTIFYTNAHSYLVRYRKDIKKARYGLSIKLIDGMLEASSDQTVFFDGCEMAYHVRAVEDVDKLCFRQRVSGREMSEVPEIYDRKMRVSFGFQMDMDWRERGWHPNEPEKNVFTPELFNAILRRALELCDGYVWVYTEKCNWFTGAELSAGYIKAVADARAYARTLDAGNPQLSKYNVQPVAKPDPGFLQVRQKTPLAPRPRITDLEHTVIHYDKGTYCGHPRMVCFKYFPPDELIVGHFHAPCKYEVYEDVRHICYQSRSKCLLQRSTDKGMTWPNQNDKVLFDNTMRPFDKRVFIRRKKAPRERYDMFKPESVFFFGRIFSWPPEPDSVPACFSLRSPDKGQTWEKQPTWVNSPLFAENIPLTRQNAPVIRMPDGKTLLAAFWITPPSLLWKNNTNVDGSAIFSSTDQGLTWNFLSRPVVDRSGEGLFIYETLLLMPNGDLHFYCIHLHAKDETVEGRKNAICLAISKDGGKSFSEPVPITGQGRGCWRKVDDSDVEYKITYRAPWPILLKDGRILVIFTRRKMPAGIGGIISSDGGKTWSEEFVIRDDGKWWDLGYPVGCQLDDGKIFTAYYYNKQDGNKQGGTRYIAGSFFRVD